MCNGTSEDRIVAEQDAPSRLKKSDEPIGSRIVAEQDAPYHLKKSDEPIRSWIVVEQDAPSRRTDLQDPLIERTIRTVPVFVGSDVYRTVKTTSHRKIGRLSYG